MIALALAVTPVIANVNGFQSAAETTVKAATSQQGKVKLSNHVTYDGFTVSIPVYNRNGKQLTNYKKLKAGSSIKYYGKPVILQGTKYTVENPFTPITIKGTNYVNLGDNGYVKQKNLGSFTPKTGIIKLVRNSYVYDSNETASA